MTAETVGRRSPVGGWQASFDALARAVRLAEVPFTTQLNLRLDPDSAAANGVASVLGAGLPTAPCTAIRAGAFDVLWLGPDEWLVLAPDGVGAAGAEDALEASLRAAIGTGHGSVIDVSAQRTMLSLAGPGAREVLAKGCSIDLHPRVSPAGTCVQTLLAQSGVLIVVRDHTASDFLLLVRASFAQYVAAWLVDASNELDA